jgi:hypothetical protein
MKRTAFNDNGSNHGIFNIVSEGFNVQLIAYAYKIQIQNIIVY